MATKKQPSTLGSFAYLPAAGETRDAGNNPLVELCSAFARAMLEKMRLNEVKRAVAGLSSNWQADDWQADCIAQLAEHVKKGDPRDTGILSAFCWFHDWHTGHVNGAEAEPSPEQAEIARLKDELLMSRFKSFGDNHHNAILCPYCNPDRLLLNEVTGKPRPVIVTLSGSTRFKAAFELANKLETRAGRIVLSVGSFERNKESALGDAVAAGLDELYLRKIEMSDEVLVLNVGGYIGGSTAKEIAHAKALGKRVRYWLDEMPSMSDPHNQAAIARAADNLPPTAEAKTVPLVPEVCKGPGCAYLASYGTCVGCGSCPVVPAEGAPDCGCEPGMCTQMPHNFCRLL